MNRIILKKSSFVCTCGEEFSYNQKASFRTHNALKHRGDEINMPSRPIEEVEIQNNPVVGLALANGEMIESNDVDPQDQGDRHPGDYNKQFNSSNNPHAFIQPKKQANTTPQVQTQTWGKHQIWERELDRDGDTIRHYRVSRVMVDAFNNVIKESKQRQKALKTMGISDDNEAQLWFPWKKAMEILGLLIIILFIGILLWRFWNSMTSKHVGGSNDNSAASGLFPSWLVDKDATIPPGNGSIY